MVCCRGGRVVAIFVFLLLTGACSKRAVTDNEHPIYPNHSETSPGISNWASKVHSIKKGSVPPFLQKIERALVPDPDYGRKQLETIRRVVYRVGFAVPPIFREGKSKLIAPAGELFIDVSQDRLRAKFVGPGWPVDENSEVRLRRDMLGVYVFDGSGGRNLGPGRMASWFEGKSDGRSRSSVRVRREHARGSQGPGELMCALLAEWTAQDRDTVMRRCSGGKLPPGFRFGPWSAELTALVPMEVERDRIRADEKQPPQEISQESRRSFLEPAEITRIAPHYRTPYQVNSSQEIKVELQIANFISSRVIVIVEGIPIGWINSDTEAVFSGFISGRYRMGAVRPFGTLLASPRSVRLPGSLVLGSPAEGSSGS